MNSKGTPANLKPFKPGQSGNPGGRPKKRPISERYEALAEELLPDDLRLMMKLGKGATWGDALAISQYRGALKGKSDAAREIREGIEGRATQRLELTGQDGGSVKLDLQATLGKIDEIYGLKTEGEQPKILGGGNGAGPAEAPVPALPPIRSGGFRTRAA